MLQVKIKSLRDPILDGYQVVVNCTGLGAREIVPDGRVFPIRGQIFRVNIDQDTIKKLLYNLY